MTKILSYELTDLAKNAGNSYGGKVRVYNAKFDLAKLTAAPTTTDLLKLCDKPHGAVLLGILAAADTTQTATFAVNGQSKNATTGLATLESGKYGTVPALTANTPALVSKVDGGDQTLFTEEITLTPSATLGTEGILEFKVFVGIV